MFVFECLCSAEDVQGYINMHHKRFKRKHTQVVKRREKKKPEISDIIQNSISCANRGKRGRKCRFLNPRALSGGQTFGGEEYFSTRYNFPAF